MWKIIAGMGVALIASTVYGLYLKVKIKETKEENEDLLDALADLNKTLNEMGRTKIDRHTFEDITKEYANVEVVEEPEEDPFSEDIHSIDPDKMGDRPIEYLTLYKDGIVVDDDADEVIPNPDDILGENWEDTFGEYEDDVAFIRNDDLEIDYEITRADTSYKEDKK